MDELIERCVAAIASLPETTLYSALPEAVIQAEHRVESDSGSEGLENFRRAVLMSILDAPHVSSPHYALTEEIAALRNASLQRMRTTCKERDGLHYAANRDLYCKDIAIAQGRMFPAGARVVETTSGLPRKLLVTKGPAQMLCYTRLLLSMGGKAPLYQLHVHLEELEEFNDAGWARTLGRLARMLPLHTEVRGVFGGGWLYDPALPVVSPRMAHIRRIAREAGAEFFYSSVDTSGDALTKSPTRRKLFDEGEYVPRAWYVIWPRTHLIQRATEW